MKRFRNIWTIGLVLGLSGCAGMRERLASHPTDPGRSSAGLLAARGGRQDRNQPQGIGSPREPSASKVASKPAKPLTNRSPEAVSRYFPGMSRRGDAAGASEAARPDPLGVRTSATEDAGNRPVAEDGPPRGGQPASSLPAALNVSVHPDDPSSLYPDALNAATPDASREAGRPVTAERPRDEPAPATRADTLPEPVEAPKTPAVAPSPEPGDSAAVEGAPAEEPTLQGPAVVPTSAAAEPPPAEAPELPGLTLDQEPVIPATAEADESVPIPVPDPAPAPVRAERPRARFIDPENDPVLAGRPRLRLVPPSAEPSRDGQAERPPDVAFPASYYAADPGARTAIATATVAPPTPARPRRSILSRLFRRSGKPRPESAATPSTRGEPRDLAQRGDLVNRVSCDCLDESPKR